MLRPWTQNLKFKIGNTTEISTDTLIYDQLKDTLVK